MIYIYGTRSVAKKKKSGKFLCPTCNAQKRYRHMRLDRYFHIFFINLFRFKRQGEYVECQSCKSQFGTEILKK